MVRGALISFQVGRLELLCSISKEKAGPGITAPEFVSRRVAEESIRPRKI
jgi:hypothetical protein